MHITSMTDAARSKRQMIMGRANGLRDKGICPTCQQFRTNEVHPSIQDQIFHDSDLMACFLEAYPRNLGHTIILVKPHYEDISELPTNMATEVHNVVQMAVRALKRILMAEKVYMCTMCDGRRNHLHFQLIPRYSGDTIRGSRLFVKDRLILKDCDDVVAQLKNAVEALNLDSME